MCVTDGEVVGGICYRPHFTQGFAEIAFCAVTASRQVKGFGTRMMNQLKQVVKKDGIEYFLTYADNYAIGYFKKQGFNRQVTMKRERWAGFIKDYDGGTLMECPLSEYVDYTDLPKMIEEQRAALIALIAERQRPFERAVHPPLAERLNFPLDEHGDVIGSRVSITTAEQIPGLVDAGVNLPRYEYRVDGKPSTLGAILEHVLAPLVKHESAWPFLAPVDVSEAADYYEVIAQPMDFATVQRRVNIGAPPRSAGRRAGRTRADRARANVLASARRLAFAGYYRTLRLFVADVRRIISNCLAYNGEDNVYGQCARVVESELDKGLATVREILLAG